MQRHVTLVTESRALETWDKMSELQIVASWICGLLATGVIILVLWLLILKLAGRRLARAHALAAVERARNRLRNG